MQQGGKVQFKAPLLLIISPKPALVFPFGLAGEAGSNGFDKLYSTLARQDQVDGRGSMHSRDVQSKKSLTKDFCGVKKFLLLLSHHVH